MSVLEGSQNAHVEQLHAYNVAGGLHQSIQVRAEDKSLYALLHPIEDASHHRDRKRSPPNSACMRGTRVQAVRNVTTWAHSSVVAADEPHIRWMHGYVGSGKSAISQEVCDTSERKGIPVASFFFFRGAGDRSKIWRLATTLASQMAAVIPETERFILAAVKANQALLRSDEGGVSVRTRIDHLVYAPFQAAVQGGTTNRTPGQRVLRGSRNEVPTIEALANGPFLIVLDGFDECDDKDEVQELIDGMVLFFEENPFIPLRVFITSRVEQHIKSRLNVPGVRLDDLVDHCSDHDIDTLLQILFEDARRRDPVIQAYVRQHGEWPTSRDKDKLVRHIGGSFIFASVVFKFIMGSTARGDSLTTPMDRLPLALKMNPGLDGLYTEILARSEHLPYFIDVVSTIGLLKKPLPTSGIADLLGISIYEVVNVLVNLQAIIQLPGTDNIPVTLFHTSLRDFLTTESRSGRLCAHPRHHVRLFFGCLEYELRLRRQQSGGFIYPASETFSALDYAFRYSANHLSLGRDFLKESEFDSAIQLRGEALELQPGNSHLTRSLAHVICIRSMRTCSLADYGKAISLYREILAQEPSGHPNRPETLTTLGNALLNRYRRAGTMADLGESVSVLREALEFQPPPHPGRLWSLNNLGNALLVHYRLTGTMNDLEEAVSLLRQALKLQPPLHPYRSSSLNDLGNALLVRYRQTGTMTNIEETVSLLREALELQPPPHPHRSSSLTNLGNTLLDCYQRTGTMTDLEEAVSLLREALELLPPPHPDRSWSVDKLGHALLDRYRCTGTMTNLEEAVSLLRQALELQPSPHPDRSWSLKNLGSALLDRYKRTGTMSDLEEALSLLREALHLRPPPHPDRSSSLNTLGRALLHRYRHAGAMTDLEEAISHLREALELRPSLHPHRSWSLNALGDALVDHYRHTGTIADLEEAVFHLREALKLRPSPHPHRSWSLNALGHALVERYRHTGAMADLEAAVCLVRDALKLQPLPHPERSCALHTFVLCLQALYESTQALPLLQEALIVCEELLNCHYPPQHKSRVWCLDTLTKLLQMLCDATGEQGDPSRIQRFREESEQLSAEEKN